MGLEEPDVLGNGPQRPGIDHRVGVMTVGVYLVIRTDKDIEPLALGRPRRTGRPKAPFAETAGRVAALVQQFSNGDVRIAETHPSGVPAYSGPPEVTSGQ